ncbi:unnamed protein product [Zymoseptoria tritici ST99CH_1A5]|uniref:YCII-related domain-containing protein n=4 Tax=Zymoseptoria tritici TaxID=1047171 RepID=A0A1X7S7L0_ZYMT9|nr:unnamed protein product [Zymoseptoria tritici ST99CH_3D7]SMR60858.1 unnamed protein product [Zymoseptoria tritici ST99CH_1E4]SMR64000.1 unnamed protein product [Zymoseptoria tritici ST99CH_3D1]SMY29352.1 unnamed protein product [Zymoseptoria tritici ST99CH_1A5]
MGKQEWLVIIKDKPNSLPARMKVRPQHLEELKPHIDSGAIVLGGATLDEPLKEGEGMKSNGSVLIIEAESEKEARGIVEGDVYYTSGVWEPESVQYHPFSSAIRKAK